MDWPKVTPAAAASLWRTSRQQKTQSGLSPPHWVCRKGVSTQTKPGGNPAIQMTLVGERSLAQPQSDDGAGGNGKPSLGADSAAAEQFLQLLGKDPARTWFRTLLPRGKGSNRRRAGCDLHGFDAAALEADNGTGEGVYFVTGDADRVTRRGVSKADVTRCRSVFVEWDERPIAWQLQAWKELNLPEPTAMVHTGGKSIHCYWLLTEPMAPDQWEPLQKRLIAYAGGDTACSDPCRPMRLPGFRYVDKETGEVTDKVAQLIHQSTACYSAAEIEACLPAPTSPPAPRLQPLATELPPRSEADLLKALEQVPEFFHDQGRRDELLGLAMRLTVEWGAEEAHTWLAQHSPTITDLAGYFTTAPTQISTGSIWPFLHEHYGISLKRHDLKRHDGQKAPAAAAEAPAANPPTTGAKPAPVSFEQRWALLEQNAEELSSKNWPLMKVMAALAVITSELELRLSSRQLEQLLEDAQRRLRGTAAPLQGGGVITVQSTPWAVEGLFRHSLNLLVGQSGAGKSRLMAACFAAWLQGHSAWLGLPMHSDLPVDQRHVLIVGSDQLMEDWLLTLEPVGLMERMGTAKARLHSRLTLHSLETGTQLDADGLAVIRRWCDDHPGCAVLVDSLAAALPPGIDEDRPAAAKPIHALQEALGTCWGVLTHHSRKGAGKEGNLGVGAGRGSSAIDAAVSRVIGLGLIHKVENGQLVAQESDPRRELLSTKRGGATLHIVVRSDGAGRWTNEGTAEELKRQERQERTLANLTDNQAAVMDALQESSDWLTSRQVVENLLADGEEYDNRGSKAASTRKTLKRLAALGLIGSQRQGSEWVYRVAGAGENQESHPHADEVKRGGSTCSTTAAQGISPALPEVRDGSTGSPAADQPGEPGRASRATGEPAGEQARTVALQGESKESQSAPRAALSTGSPPPAELMEQLIALRQQHPTAAPAALAIHMDPTGTGKPSGRQVKAWISWLDRQEAAA